MRLYGYEVTGEYAYKPIFDRVVQLENPLTIKLLTSMGNFTFRLEKGFTWDGRSGGPLIDYLAPNQGKLSESLMWLCHDAGGYPDTLGSPDLDNQILEAWCLFNGYTWLVRKAIRKAVDIAAKSWFVPTWDQVEDPWLMNRGKVALIWSAESI